MLCHARPKNRQGPFRLHHSVNRLRVCLRTEQQSNTAIGSHFRAPLIRETSIPLARPSSDQCERRCESAPKWQTACSDQKNTGGGEYPRVGAPRRGAGSAGSATQRCRRIRRRRMPIRSTLPESRRNIRSRSRAPAGEHAAEPPLVLTCHRGRGHLIPDDRMRQMARGEYRNCARSAKECWHGN
jgi:hypothetical protein